MGKSLITGGGAPNEASGSRDDGAAQRRSTPAKGFAPNVIPAPDSSWMPIKVRFAAAKAR